MAKAVRYHKQGGPEVLQLDDVQVGDPGQGQVRIKHTAIGVNFVDTYQRSGLYPMQLPAVAGNEAAGVVDAVGAGVTDLKAGDRICYTGLPGSYCDARLVPADRTVKLPQGISEEQAASMLLKGLTVHYLIFSTYPVKKGERADRLPVAQGARRHHHRHRGLAGKACARQGARRRARDQLFERGLRQTRQGHHRRKRRAGGL